MREKKAIACILISFVYMAVMIPAALAATETFHETYDVKPGTPLIVRNKNGGIIIRMWENETVDVVAEKRTRTSGKLKDVEVQVSVGETMTVETVYLIRNPRVSVNYTISVPASIIVEQVASSNGAISLQGTHGDVIAKTSNGGVKIHQHIGKVSVETSNGGIDLQHIDGYVSAETSNGAINIVDVAGIRRAQTSNGSIQAEVREIAEEGLELRTSNGSINVSLNPKLNADLELKTSNGKISIEGVEIITKEVSKNSLEGRIGNGGKKLAMRTSNGRIEVGGLK